MGSILHTESFRTRFDPTARLHLRALYTEAKGVNVRNKLAHGVLGENFLGRGVANWVIHSLLLIASMSVASRPLQPRTWTEDLVVRMIEKSIRLDHCIRRTVHASKAAAICTVQVGTPDTSISSFETP